MTDLDFWLEPQGHLYDTEGNPINLLDWAMAYETGDRVVGQDKIGGYYISTVWIGISLDDPPLIYETMIFAPDGEPIDCWRYATRAEAREGHRKAKRGVPV